MWKRSWATWRAPSPRRHASAGSSRRWRIASARCSTRVSAKQETPFWSTIAIPVVARTTTGIPSIIASQTASGRLV